MAKFNCGGLMRAYWVGVLKSHWQNHRVFEFDGDPSEEDAPDCDYVIGPFADKKAAKERARTEQNQTGMFTDPFGPKPYGR